MSLDLFIFSNQFHWPRERGDFSSNGQCTVPIFKKLKRPRPAKIEPKNGKKEAVTVVVYDQVPLSNQKDIEVKIEEMSAAQYNSETGEIKWTLTLAPGETVKKRLAFKVKYPKDKQIMGL